MKEVRRSGKRGEGKVRDKKKGRDVKRAISKDGMKK